MKSFELDKVPAEAYAAIAASQSSNLFVNGKQASRIMADGTRSGRIAIYDVKSQLIAGRNVLTIDVASHTEKLGLTEEEVAALVRHTAFRGRLGQHALPPVPRERREAVGLVGRLRRDVGHALAIGDGGHSADSAVSAASPAGAMAASSRPSGISSTSTIPGHGFKPYP